MSSQIEFLCGACLSKFPEPFDECPDPKCPSHPRPLRLKPLVKIRTALEASQDALSQAQEMGMDYNMELSQIAVALEALPTLESMQDEFVSVLEDLLQDHLNSDLECDCHAKVRSLLERARS